MGRTIVYGCFEWDEEKNELNIRKHGISFEEATEIFDDPLFWERYDRQHSSLDETRFVGIGKINGFTVVSSCYIDRNGRTRIINARRATRKEIKDYEQHCWNFFHA